MSNHFYNQSIRFIFFMMFLSLKLSEHRKDDFIWHEFKINFAKSSPE
jgi:hypothetical protein